MRLARAYFRFPGATRPLIDIKNGVLPDMGFVTLVAPSGSGKTTLFKLLSGWFGSEADSQCVIDPPLESAAHIRFLGGHTSMLPWMTVRRNVELHGSRYADVAKLLRDVELDDSVSNAFPYQLSLGMSKRVEILMAVASGARVILLDEVFESFDDNIKVAVSNFLRKKAGASLIWIITHDMTLASQLSLQCLSLELADGIVVGWKPK